MLVLCYMSSRRSNEIEQQSRPYMILIKQMPGDSNTPAQHGKDRPQKPNRS